MQFFNNPFTRLIKSIGSFGQRNVGDNIGQGAANIAKIVIPAAFAYAGGAALAGGEAGVGTGEGLGAGEGGYEVLEGMPPLGDGMEGGAMDMYGSQSSPTDASNIFEPSPHGPQSLDRANITQQLMQNRMPLGGQRYQQPPRQQPNFVFPSPIVSVMPKDTYGSY